MSAKRILIIGATSAIAEAVARIHAARGDALYLLARNIKRAQAIAEDLRVRGAASVHCAVLDVADVRAHPEAIAHAIDALGGLDVALIAHGTLPDQSRCNADVEYALDQFAVNGTATISLAAHLAQRLAKQGFGSLAVIASVAGDRGRASNYLYGSAKAGVSAFMSGLRQRLHGSGVNVLTIKPGFVDTPMTAAFKKGVLWAKPARVAQGILRALDKRKSVVYLPWFWRPIMAVIRAIPEPVFRRIRL